tara:strand:- start:853 stop:1338 length:486 start_codon:yes stop_codon:yes gene_type:complete
MTKTVYDFSCKTQLQEDKSLQDYAGKVVLIVNTASKCGFTPQFAGLEDLHQKLNSRGLEILGFPCNQFGKQDPGTNEEISEFCQLNYGISFTMFNKIEVNGDNASPLFKFLKRESPGIVGTESIKWNFTKFLINQSGQVLKRYAPTQKPATIEADILDLLT